MADVNIRGEVPASSLHHIVSSPASLASAASSSQLSAFKCDDIENFLNSFQPGSGNAIEEPDPCPTLPDASPSSPLSPATDDCLPPAPCNVSRVRDEPSLADVCRVFELPKSILVFNHRIFITGHQNNLKNVEIFKSKQAVDLKEVQATRFPPDLISCFGDEFPPSASEGDGPTSSGPKAGSPSAHPKVRRKRRKRFSLLEVEKFHFENGKERELLLPDAYDLKTAFSKVLPGRNIPFVYRCRDTEEHDCTVKCAKSADNFKLYMSIGPNNGTLPPPIVSKNILSNLRQDSTVIDKTLALIATTALHTKNQPNFRIFMPVSEHISKCIPIARDIQNGPLLDAKLEIDDSVRTVVDEMVKFVERQLNATEPDYDPDCHELSSFDSSINGNMENLSSGDPSKTSTSDTSNCRRYKRGRRKTDRVIRELKKLANISVTDESSALGSVKKSENCTELFCKLGCVCDSLSIKPPPPNHCGNSDCLFGCLCGEKQRYVYVPVEELAKNEKSWHQTVVRKADNCVEIQSGISRGKRATKPPERFEDWNPGTSSRSRKKNAQVPSGQGKGEEKIKPAVNKKMEKIDQGQSTKDKNSKKKILQKLGDGNNTETSHSSKVSEFLKRMNNELGKSTELDKKIIKKVSLSKKFFYCRSAGKTAKSLADIFIYCTIHDTYDCECDGWIVLLKNGDMLLKSAFTQTEMMDEALKTISLSNTTSFRKKAMVYDLARHSARTAPPVINYVERNKSKIFKKKSSIALSYGVPSYTNSFVKVPEVPLVSYCEDEAKGSNPSFLGTDAVKTGVGRVIKLSTKLGCEIEQFGVIDEMAHIAPSSTVNGVDNESDSDEVPQGTFTIAEPPKKRLRPKNKHDDSESSNAASPNFQPGFVHQKQIKNGVLIDLSSDEPSDERQEDDPIVISDDDEGDEQLPDFGMFCQSHPDLGYVRLENRGDGFFGIRGFSEQIDKFSFSEIKQVAEFLKQFLDHTGFRKYANSKWVKVTKGVLQLKKCSKFVPDEFLMSEGGPSLSKTNVRRPPQHPLQELQQQQQVPPNNLVQQRLSAPAGSEYIISPVNPNEPMQRIQVSGTVAHQTGSVLPFATQTATLVAKTSPPTVASPSPAVVTLWTQQMPIKPSQPPKTADVFVPLNDQTIKIISPPLTKRKSAQSPTDKNAPVAYLYNKKQLPSNPVKSLLAKRKLDGNSIQFP